MKTLHSNTTWQKTGFIGLSLLLTATFVHAQPNDSDAAGNATEKPYAIIQLYEDDVSKLADYYQDLDQDGVADELDHCPNSRLKEAVDKNGCALIEEAPQPVMVQCEDGSQASSLAECPAIDNDTDRDGVLNAVDKCPNTPAGVEVDANGCKKGTFVLSNIVFDSNSAKIRDDQINTLKSNAAALNALEKNEVLLVTGHTDSVGSDAHNLKLSWARAESTKQFLQQLPALKEVTIRVLGRGETTPIADNATAEGRQANRRIELQIIADTQVPAEAR
ncbi:OmpA family protein [Thiomicrorhabdus cannonii]|uniref:OmpA family protein n=1 Tax=Thiomicrorhabdus cannonii TaxID=2748011 RepID=UPI0015BC22BF|nr:OmpA family protein [Thiomicrorhabdus cannonii]